MTWVVIITILFMLPQVGPITWSTFNYAVFAVVAVIGFAGIYWLASARNWFTGPRVQGTRGGTGRDRAGTGQLTPRRPQRRTAHHPPGRGALLGPADWIRYTG